MINFYYPTHTYIKGRRYNINTSYKTAIECNEIATDENINEFEKGLAIIYKIFGDDGLDNKEDYEELLICALKFLSCGQEIKQLNSYECDMDYIQDLPLIKASFRSDYNINLNNEDMHWWEFTELINGLSNSEFGNCCILNKIRNLRNMDTSKIKDNKLKSEIEKSKEYFKLNKQVRKKFTTKQKNNIDNFYKLTGIERSDN